MQSSVVLYLSGIATTGAGYASRFGCPARGFRLTNPFAPPASDLGDSSERQPIPLGPTSGLVVGCFFLGAAVYYVARIIYLHRVYPGLWDPSPNVDAYWPAVVEIVYYVFAGIAAAIGFPTLWVSVVVFRRRQIRFRASQLTEDGRNRGKDS